MLSAARAPRAPLGARLYSARRAAELNIDEAGFAAGAEPHIVAGAEAFQAVLNDASAALEALITQRGPR
ncbi:hypothetical protein H7J06_29465 [Mycobacterium hodleri]|uniref:hypothetical protein n=1 Tax=Mycolicibacterium hodleri TaxID=49897 RepID=UPI000B12243A|nr:hypothetical protein [Mycolicibacterium hodleri]MCV7137098.1 hypothetical protein [Mycolicibacterium hodleri]